MKRWLLLLIALATPRAFALSSHTYVSAAGDDVNPCSRAQPCRTFAMAINLTASNGTITPIDDASYGSLTITKPVTIDAGGHAVTMTALSGSVITINTPGADDLVALRGLSFDGFGAAASGIHVYAVGQLVVEHCTIQNVNGHGIDFGSTTNPSHLLVGDSTIANNLDASGTSSGVYQVAPFGNVALERVRVVNNGIGVQVRAGTLSIRDSTLVGNVQTNVKLIAAGVARIDIDNTLIAGSAAGTGVFSQGIAASVYVSNSTVTGNNQGLATLIGTINSFGNNRVFGNNSDGAFTTKLSPE